jgi:hypothetical protein
MEYSRAVDQISEIHAQIAKGEVYRGWRPVPVALSGFTGILAAWAQPAGLGSADPAGFIYYWVAVAVASAAVGSSEIVLNYALRENVFERRRTRRVAAQFLPSVAAAAIVTASILRFGSSHAWLLPGTWAIAFGVGIFACRPYLPRASGWTALFYLCAGAWLLLAVGDTQPLSGWSVGATFGTGQLLAAIALYANVERNFIA